MSHKGQAAQQNPESRSYQKYKLINKNAAPSKQKKKYRSIY